MEPAKAVETKPSGRVSVFPILAVNFVGTLGFSIVLPFLVYLVTKLGGNALVYGVMGATYSFFQLLGAESRSLASTVHRLCSKGVTRCWRSKTRAFASACGSSRWTCGTSSFAISSR